MHNSCRLPCEPGSRISVDKPVRSPCPESLRCRAWRRRHGTVAARLTGTLLASLLWVASAAAQTAVDLELVIAVDVSLSMDLDEQRLQREGYVAAFRDAALQKAIASGPQGRIAVVYMEWAGPHWQSVIIPWTVIDGVQAARAFADRLEAQPITRERWTSISGALQFAKSLLGKSNAAGPRRVIDISGDGPNNAGPPVLAVRAALLADGIVINGLPIMLKAASPGFFDLPDLDSYYAGCVIGGPGSFMVPVKTVAELKEAIRRKLLLEIAGLDGPALVVPTQTEPAYDCLIGEKQWQWYQDRGPN
jgi:Protein of unknown function (DUF1194)